MKLEKTMRAYFQTEAAARKVHRALIEAGLRAIIECQPVMRNQRVRGLKVIWSFG